jgi:hypothetical protein
MIPARSAHLLGLSCRAHAMTRSRGYARFRRGLWSGRRRARQVQASRFIEDLSFSAVVAESIPVVVRGVHLPCHLCEIRRERSIGGRRGGRDVIPGRRPGHGLRRRHCHGTAPRGDKLLAHCRDPPVDILDVQERPQTVKRDIDPFEYENSLPRVPNERAQTDERGELDQCEPHSYTSRTRRGSDPGQDSKRRAVDASQRTSRGGVRIS